MSTSANTRNASWFKWPIVAATVVALLWLVFGLYGAGQAAWAVAVLALGGISIYVYASAQTLAWRYLLPGVAGMLVFVAFPLVYTMQIGFTNYSASNLLSEARARAYLLDQATVDEDHALAFTLHAESGGMRILLTPPEAASEPM